jgi:hypothetical protein
LSRHEQRLQCSKIFGNCCRIDGSRLQLPAHLSSIVLNTLHDSLQIRGAIRARRGRACGRNCWSTLSTATTSAATTALGRDRRDHHGEHKTYRN